MPRKKRPDRVGPKQERPREGGAPVRTSKFSSSAARAVALSATAQTERVRILIGEPWLYLVTTRARVAQALVIHLERHGRAFAAILGCPHPFVAVGAPRRHRSNAYPAHGSTPRLNFRHHNINDRRRRSNLTSTRVRGRRDQHVVQLRFRGQVHAGPFYERILTTRIQWIDGGAASRLTTLRTSANEPTAPVPMRTVRSARHRFP